MRILILIVPLLVVAQLPDQPPLAPWASNRHPTDSPKRHVETITAGRHVYTVRQGGTMDGTNCRSPVGVGMSDNRPGGREVLLRIGFLVKAVGQLQRLLANGFAEEPLFI